MGSSTENSAFRVTSNPWDLERVPGGSSGGSAAAVAAGEAIAALGSDTGGSIRQPAALCNLVGLKPSYGRVSRYGLIAFASSLDQIGPFARSVEDAALVLRRDRRATIRRTRRRSGWRFPTTWAGSRRCAARAAPGSSGSRRSILARGSTRRSARPSRAPSTRTAGWAAKSARSRFPTPGTRSGPTTSSRPPSARRTWRASTACATGTARRTPTDALDLYFKSRAEGFGPEVKRRIILGTYVLSSGYYDAYYLRAQKVRTLIRRDFLEAYKQVDAIVTPTSPTPAFRKGEKAANPLAMYLSDIYTIGVNLAGLPGISIPCGFTKGGLPIGLQVIGQPFKETELLAIAGAYEAGADWRRRHPDAMNYEAVIGLEVHVQLKTRSKMFTRAAAGYGLPENTLTDPVVLALPGTLPVMNKEALDKIIKAGLLLGCEIAPRVQVGPKELLLSRLPEELPDLPVRPAALQGGLGRDRAARPRAQRHGRAQADRAHPHPPRGGRRQAQPRRGGVARRLQPRGHAADGDRLRAGDPQRRRGVRLPDGAQDAHDLRRDLRLRHGEGAAALRREHLDPACGHDRPRHEGRAEEPQLDLVRARRYRP